MCPDCSAISLPNFPSTPDPGARQPRVQATVRVGSSPRTGNDKHVPSLPLPPTASAHYQVLRTVPSYDEAQRLVDRLSDAGFPVEHVRLVGTDLRLVEQVTGRMTYGKAALYGAASGAWLGLLIGLLLGLFTVVGWLSVILWAVLLGAVWG